MIAGLFLNPGFLLVAAALISIPIIIHLINRMRFKRIRWAAMEFLLKAQKRTRRRLIIEQLLLLALRCLLIGLVGILVSRFVGCGDTNAGGKPSLHLVLLDDTLSMQDNMKTADGSFRVCFDVAKTDFLIKKIGKGLAASKTNDQLMVVQLSRLDEADYKPDVFTNLNDSAKFKEFSQRVTEYQASPRNVSMMEGIKVARKLIGDNAESRITLHLLNDFRSVDWSSKSGEGMYKELIDLVKNNKELKLRPIDAALPMRGPGYPKSSPNVGIVDIRPSTRIVGHKMPVHFTIDIANYGDKPVDVKLVARNEETGKDMMDVDFDIQGAKEDRTRIRLMPGTPNTITFDYGDIKHGLFFPEGLKAGESKIVNLSVRLVNDQLGPLPPQIDGLQADNIRYTAIEVRDKVPILVVDGDAVRGRDEGKDSYILERSLASITGASYQVEFGDIVARTNVAAKALELPDLGKYPTIFICNVRELTDKQATNLEKFVKDGGGVAFYMGPLVNAAAYNKLLYKEGKGVLPAPLQTPTFFPPASDPELKDKDTDTYQLLVRDEKLSENQKRTFPIFGKIFEEPIQREPLKHLPIRRYHKVDRSAWKKDPGRITELATLPNEAPVKDFQARVVRATINGPNVVAVLGNAKLDKYRQRLEVHLKNISDTVQPGSEAKAYHLAARIDALMTDQGSPNWPDMTKLWESGDEKASALQDELNKLREDVNYGDPFIIHQTFGKGKVVAVMSTVGKDWNDWCGGCTGSVVFPAFIWELQNELSSPGADANLTVGNNLPPLELDAEQFRGTRLKLVRHFLKPDAIKPAAKGAHGDPQVGDEKEGKISFRLVKHNEPGVYISELFDDNNADKPLAVIPHVFNVDTQREGPLQRNSTEELTRELETKANEAAQRKDAAKIVATGAADEVLVAKHNDFSESPWLFLILLFVLVAEQALAVHLSFHLKNADDAAMSAAKG